jgi:hypothetical protein
MVRQNHYKPSVSSPRHHRSSAYTNPGLDITAGVFPFFLREGAIAVGRGGAEGVSIFSVFWRFVRREEEGFAGSAPGSGLGSRAGAFRFLDGARVRVDKAVEAPTEALGDSAEASARLAADLVILSEGMSMCVFEELLLRRLKEQGSRCREG